MINLKKVLVILLTAFKLQALLALSNFAYLFMLTFALLSLLLLFNLELI